MNRKKKIDGGGVEEEYQKKRSKDTDLDGYTKEGMRKTRLLKKRGKVKRKG